MMNGSAGSILTVTKRATGFVCLAALAAQLLLCDAARAGNYKTWTQGREGVFSESAWCRRPYSGGCGELCNMAVEENDEVTVACGGRVVFEDQSIGLGWLVVQEAAFLMQEGSLTTMGAFVGVNGTFKVSGGAFTISDSLTIENGGGQIQSGGTIQSKQMNLRGHMEMTAGRHIGTLYVSPGGGAVIGGTSGLEGEYIGVHGSGSSLKLTGSAGADATGLGKALEVADGGVIELSQSSILKASSGSLFIRPGGKTALSGNASLIVDDELNLLNDGTLDIRSRKAQLRSGTVLFGWDTNATQIFNAVPGTVIYPGKLRLEAGHTEGTGLDNARFVFKADGMILTTPFAVEDRGCTLDGFEHNNAIGYLDIGKSKSRGIVVQLGDPEITDPSVLYVRNLFIAPGCTLKIANGKLVYMNAIIGKGGAIIGDSCRVAPGLILSEGPINPDEKTLQSIIPDGLHRHLVTQIRLNAPDKEIVVKGLTFTFDGDGSMAGLEGGGLWTGAGLYLDANCSGAMDEAVGLLEVDQKTMVFDDFDATIPAGGAVCFNMALTFNKDARGVYSAESTAKGVRGVDGTGASASVLGGSVVGLVELNLDKDGDALLDYWEEYGYDHDGDGVADVDLPAMGAKADHKDILVEIDWMADAQHSHRPSAKAMKAVYDAFAAASVDNPDGKKGINLILDGGKWGGGNAVLHDPDLNPVWKELKKIMKANFSDERRRIFHYCLFAHNYNGKSSSGISSGIPGSSFIVSLGSWTNGVGTVKQQAGTFMHEFGHNLGLRHGGNDHENYKPNFISIMNYFFQMDWLRYDGKDQKLDFSSLDLKNLSEANLNEKRGIDHVGGDKPLRKYGTRFYDPKRKEVLVDRCNAQMDWDKDSEIQKHRQADINGDGKLGILTGRCIEWSILKFNGGTIGVEPVPSEVSIEQLQEELTVVEYLRMKRSSSIQDFSD